MRGGGTQAGWARTPQECAWGVCAPLHPPFVKPHIGRCGAFLGGRAPFCSTTGPGRLCAHGAKQVAPQSTSTVQDACQEPLAGGEGKAHPGTIHLIWKELVPLHWPPGSSLQGRHSDTCGMAPMWTPALLVPHHLAN